jgi:hypothetical protein
VPDALPSPRRKQPDVSDTLPSLRRKLPDGREQLSTAVTPAQKALRFVSSTREISRAASKRPLPPDT